MQLSDGYECEIVENAQVAVGAFDGIPFEAVQAPILPDHVFDVDAGMTLAEMGVTWETKTPGEVFEDIVHTMQHIESTPNVLNLPLSIFKYPKASRKMRKAHALWVSWAVGMKLKEAKGLCRKASK